MLNFTTKKRPHPLNCFFASCRLGHVNKINCFSSFCLQKFGEGGGYLLFIFRGQRSYATIFTGVKLGYKRRVKGKTGRSKRVKTNKKKWPMDVRILELSFIFTIANESRDENSSRPSAKIRSNTFSGHLFLPATVT